jgi:hypothetical protein
LAYNLFAAHLSNIHDLYLFPLLHIR